MNFFICLCFTILFLLLHYCIVRVYIWRLVTIEEEKLSIYREKKGQKKACMNILCFSECHSARFHLLLVVLSYIQMDARSVFNMNDRVEIFFSLVVIHFFFLLFFLFFCFLRLLGELFCVYYKLTLHHLSVHST